MVVVAAHAKPQALVAHSSFGQTFTKVGFGIQFFGFCKPFDMFISRSHIDHGHKYPLGATLTRQDFSNILGEPQVANQLTFARGGPVPRASREQAQRPFLQLADFSQQGLGTILSTGGEERLSVVRGSTNANCNLSRRLVLLQLSLDRSLRLGTTSLVSQGEKPKKEVQG